MVAAGRTVANPQQNPADGSAAELPHGSDYSWPRFSNPTSSVEWLGAESNRRHVDFQSTALPTELPSRDRRRIARRREVFTMQQCDCTARLCRIHVRATQRAVISSGALQGNTKHEPGFPTSRDIAVPGISLETRSEIESLASGTLSAALPLRFAQNDISSLSSYTRPHEEDHFHE